MPYNRNALITKFFRSLSSSDQDEWLHYRKACDKSLYFFIKYIGGYARKAGGDIIEEIHKPICDFWQDKTLRRKGVAMPRYWRKTTSLTEWGNLWEYLQDNETRILIPTEKMDTGSSWLQFIEGQVMQNERLRWQYPELQVVNRSYAKLNPWSGQRCRLPRQGVYPEATFTVVGIRGASQGGHFDIISGDDLVGEKGMESALVLEDALRWFDNIEELLVNPDANSPTGSVCRLTGTHWSPGDYICWINDNYANYKWLKVSCIKRESTPNTATTTYIDNPNVPVGDSNFPVFPKEHYIEMQNNPSKAIIYWAQHMNDPVAESPLTKFDIHWFRYFHFEDRVIDGAPVKFIVCDDDKEEFRLDSIPLYGMIDPGGFSEVTLDKFGARNAIVIGGQPLNTVKKFVVDTWAGRPKDPDVFRGKVFELDDKWHPRGWRIETIAAQEYIKRDLQLVARNQKRRFVLTSMDKTSNKGEKDDDIQALIPMAKNGEIYLQRSQRELVAEITNYPRSPTVDLVDMLGKINKYCWSRRKREDSSLRNRVTTQDWQGMSPTTGY